ncbi:hypothetical protein TYRP_002108 [Tyrophagus putrescentiae]|nr:hypothetical protein TYRP_002108 [Tyrophagus putrescentiae]
MKLNWGKESALAGAGAGALLTPFSFSGPESHIGHAIALVFVVTLSVVSVVTSAPLKSEDMTAVTEEASSPSQVTGIDFTGHGHGTDTDTVVTFHLHGLQPKTPEKEADMTNRYKALNEELRTLCSIDALSSFIVTRSASSAV